MVGRTTPTTIPDLCKMVELLAKYEDELIYEAQDGAPIKEDPHDVALRELAIQRISDALKTVREDLYYRLQNY